MMKRRAERHWSPKQKAHQAIFVMNGCRTELITLCEHPERFNINSEVVRDLKGALICISNAIDFTKETTGAE